MATEITLTRQTRASKLDELQTDDGLWKVGQELEAYLRNQDLRRLTADELVAFLIPLHNDATLTKAFVQYHMEYDPGLNRWIKVCTAESTIFIPDGPVEDSILVGVKVSARYE